MKAEANEGLLKYEPKEHAGKPVIFIRFEYDKELNQRIKALVGAKWSRTEKAWYVADNAGHRKSLGCKNER